MSPAVPPENMPKKQETLKDLYQDMKSCKRCRLSITRTQPIAGEGNANARLMIVALSPGEKEDSKNTMFIGPSGQILDRLLQAAGINREQIYMTNLIKCMLPKNRKPKIEEIDACSPVMDEEISIIDPEVIVPLGYYATRTVLMKYHAEAPAARKNYSERYGELFFSNDQKIFPLPHPASLIYKPSFEKETISKYKTLHVLLQDCKWFPVCPMKWFYEMGKLEKKWIELYCRGNWKNCIRYKMEEQGRPHPDWMLPDGSMDKNIR